jgi:hypothetical protein
LGNPFGGGFKNIGQSPEWFGVDETDPVEKMVSSRKKPDGIEGTSGESEIRICGGGGKVDIEPGNWVTTIFPIVLRRINLRRFALFGVDKVYAKHGYHWRTWESSTPRRRQRLPERANKFNFLCLGELSSSLPKPEFDFLDGLGNLRLICISKPLKTNPQ